MFASKCFRLRVVSLLAALVMMLSAAPFVRGVETKLTRPTTPEYGIISAGMMYTAYLTPEGTVRTSDDQATTDWRNIVAIDAGFSHIAGLKSDGTVVTTDKSINVSGWKDIVAVSAGNGFLLGLRSDGTVVAKGDNSHGQCKVSRWKNIVGISAGMDHAVAVREDGTVVATGKNQFGECDVEDWEDIVQVSTFYCYTIGLKQDGTVIVAGSPEVDSCIGPSGTLSWKNITSVSAGWDTVYGLDRMANVYSFKTSFTSDPLSAQHYLDWPVDSEIEHIDAGAYHLACQGSYDNLYFIGGGQCGETDACRLLQERGCHSVTKTGKQYECTLCGFRLDTKPTGSHCDHYPSSQLVEDDLFNITWVCNKCGYEETSPRICGDSYTLEGRIILDRENPELPENVVISDYLKNYKGMVENGVHVFLSNNPYSDSYRKDPIVSFDLKHGGYLMGRIISGNMCDPDIRINLVIYADGEFLMILPDIGPETEIPFELDVSGINTLTIEVNNYSDATGHIIFSGNFY